MRTAGKILGFTLAALVAVQGIGTLMGCPMIRGAAGGIDLLMFSALIVLYTLKIYRKQ